MYIITSLLETAISADQNREKMSGKAERTAKRSRRLSTDSDDQEEEYDWSDRRQRPETAGRPSSRGRAASGAK